MEFKRGLEPKESLGLGYDHKKYRPIMTGKSNYVLYLYKGVQVKNPAPCPIIDGLGELA